MSGHANFVHLRVHSAYSLLEGALQPDEIAALASRKSLGTEVSFGDKTLKIRDIEQFDWTGWDIALFAAGSAATQVYAPKAAASVFCRSPTARRTASWAASSPMWSQRRSNQRQAGIIPTTRMISAR